jgi:hypothetical protein
MKTEGVGGKGVLQSVYRYIPQQLLNQKLEILILTSVYLARIQFHCNFSKLFDYNPEKTI